MSVPVIPIGTGGDGGGRKGRTAYRGHVKDIVMLLDAPRLKCSRFAIVFITYHSISHYLSFNSGYLQYMMLYHDCMSITRFLLLPVIYAVFNFK